MIRRAELKKINTETEASEYGIQVEMFDGQMQAVRSTVMLDNLQTNHNHTAKQAFFI